MEEKSSIIMEIGVVGEEVMANSICSIKITTKHQSQQGLTRSS